MESNAKNVVTRESVLAAVTKSGDALEYAPNKLRADREIVLAAVTENGWALEHASKNLKPRYRDWETEPGIIVTGKLLQ